MNETGLDFGNEKISTLFKKLFFPTLLGMLSVSAVTTIDGDICGPWSGQRRYCCREYMYTAAYVSYGRGTDGGSRLFCYCLNTPFTG